MIHATQKAPARTVARYGLLIAVAGAVIQLLLGVYYLAMGHAPQPHDLPVGVVASGQQRQELTAQLEADGQFEAEPYQDQDQLVAAIRSRDAYGGVVVDQGSPSLLVASAAAPAVASLLRTAFDEAYQQRLQQDVAAATGAQAPVPAATVVALTTPPTTTDVVPLPDDDRAGSSLGFLVQALCLGGSVSSLALGRLGRLTRRSLRRGVGHAALLVLYAAASAAVVLLAAGLLGVVSTGADHLALFLGFALVSLAVTASTAAAVALVGPAGALLGALYFTLGLVISGSSIAPEMLPDAGRVIGQLLPPGAGATLVRDALYFPEADASGALLTLVVFSVAGLAVVLLVNAAANRTRQTSTLAINRAVQGDPVA